jgi:TATA-box binding protein (TBP) (component of TFIID and TFIIIB)
MSTPGSKASLPQEVEEAGFRGVGKIRPARKPGASNAKGKPITASRSLKSISSAYNTNINRAPNIDVQNDAISANLSRYFSYLALKAIQMTY